MQVRTCPGKKQYLELLLKAFYDQSILTDLNMEQLIGVLGLALQLDSTVFVNRCIQLISAIEMNDVDTHGTIHRMAIELNLMGKENEECMLTLRTKLVELRFCHL